MINFNISYKINPILNTVYRLSILNEKNSKYNIIPTFIIYVANKSICERYGLYLNAMVPIGKFCFNIIIYVYVQYIPSYILTIINYKYLLLCRCIYQNTNIS